MIEQAIETIVREALSEAKREIIAEMKDAILAITIPRKEYEIKGVRELAKYLHVGINKAQEYAKDPRLPCGYHGRTRVFLASEVDKFRLREIYKT